MSTDAIPLFALMVIGVPVVAYVRARWIEASIGIDRQIRTALTEDDFDQWEQGR